MNSSAPAQAKPGDFIRDIINDDLEAKRHAKVITRFPPEPNGFLHIGHAKSICLNFGLALDYREKLPDSGTRCHLRFDDTDPAKEDTLFEDGIQADVRWLGFEWDGLYHASDYFEKMYEYAEHLITAGKAYVCSLSDAETKAHRGNVTTPGTNSPYRERTVEENLDLFRRMRKGEFKDGEHVLRAKIDMANANMKMRDPMLYRIRHTAHHMTGDTWCIYPMYDYAHPISDAIEGITHSICTLEFENNRELYDWMIDNLIDYAKFPSRPHQYEFARLNLNYTVMSKRRLLELVTGNHVSGWDDPRLPTIAGLRRRGYTPESIRAFCASVGVSKANSTVDMAQLEFCIRDDLNHKAPRVMAVLKPLKVVIENYPDDKVEELDASYWPHDVPKEGSRKVPFSKEIYIEQDDFMENAPKDYFRLAPGKEVRLRYAYFITCTDVVKDAAGNVIELKAKYDTETPLGENPVGRKVKGTIHWVDAKHSVDSEIRLYDRLLSDEAPPAGKDSEFLNAINPNALQVLTGCKVERSLGESKPGERFQFERQGYFINDKDSTDKKPVFNRIVTLKDSWARSQKK
ncbi:MAG: glutamine--tRNA ligase/YqeY domain fusion protein [Candidatus Obscuribacter sp.]|jgi:glutaminyl-tRNA synthetase|nr:glutamine--tRNA ligase/YqeY domain fusion protein [Candidatus Obscuribacter sp.]MDQ5964715.1 glutaminyl-tRNA synthetase [Cyanobacteriota bacterium erpe_2018_sw_39hr_WHONDRS-SW48-000098_B_bin.30]MBK7841020.1 glutamine--tRNA ligase/YqeY domain fusion protein [Candidatus Obscuribacter sp.]MBK9205662.1 glutamine--tRNA ligase/YqeY domain fusion protein [Candidatus Obscuribacter sp.]MBK9620692.1 glutamine--tRNA ligase/YqeY domain fusion protein [Candidatus Obscuribacter sp.]